MSKIIKFLGCLSSSQILLIQKLLPKKYYEVIETLRLKKWISETDFNTFTPNKGLAVIENGLFDYPLFQMCFFNNMIANSIYCMSKGYYPIINYIDKFEGHNLWEQFYTQPYNKKINNDNVDIHCTIKQAQVYFPVFPTKEEITLYASIYRRLAVLNKETKKYIDNEIKHTIDGKRVIGVLCRGTDYTDNKPANHPIQPDTKDVIELLRNKLCELKCDYIYVATEEEKLFNLFEKEFPGQVISNKREYYDAFYDVKAESGENARISMVHHNRKNDNYLKSLEYLSSLYILSECTALIAGNTGGSRMAVILNDNKYEFCHLFNLGLY